MYVQGFVIPVPEGNKQAYTELAEKAASLFTGYGATEIVEAWEEDVADGEHTDFRKAVKAEEGEKIVFSWIIWPDRATCDAAAQKMGEDPEMENAFGEMPFDGKRMFWGGFSPVFTQGRD